MRVRPITAGAALLFTMLLGSVHAGPVEEETKKEKFDVMVHVDFGPAHKPAREERLSVNAGSTPKDAVSLLFPIQSGATCCDTRETAAIDGVFSDPAGNRWWSCRVNGSTKVSPFRTELKPGDRVEWIYREQPQ